MDILQTIQDVQKNVDDANKNIQWVKDHEIELIAGLFLFIVFACVVANFVNGK